ncbi:transcriptional regulator, ArsR family [Thermovirga lienii DSM 17291]|uniref:Transcriptional regulator, ArsR family n=1 Tax=Thermovirga lienii (strain ATCC BAA-1197 / DSM 17291 / Cas60314) TaxID=580340 RepID=G7V732_THELD|nr:metalloregulator ArsR/SmtB family transcription factor [Thermovirga lienii]AER66066.1 transcriptional regulator, ArsR family [Thermovirga lienii DSM 17291]KUK42672.1 MAG: Transcriptional regulator, ArsR family [Thermovirga lienii]
MICYNDNKNYERKVEILKAMAHPVRLAILEKLRAGDMCACVIADMFESDRTTVSKHLAILKKAGLVDDIKEGRNIIYHLKMPCILDVMPCIEKVINQERERKCCSSGSE